jgi:type IV pilus assembly protein PilB
MKPERAALNLVPETMATVYRVLPLTFQDGVLTVAISAEDEGVLSDLKNILGVREVRCVLRPLGEIEKDREKAYSSMG